MWDRKNIAEVYFYQEGPGVRKHQFKSSGIKLLNGGNINNGKIDLTTTDIYISEEEAYNKYSHFMIDSGDLLIACSGIVVSNFHNKIAFISDNQLPLCLNTSTMRFKSLDKTNASLNYFKYFLQTNDFKSQLGKLITGSAQLNFGPSHIKQMTIPLPPLHIQEKIAEILDKADELRRKDQELQAKYDQLAQAIFIDMFGDPVKNEKGWEVKKLEEVVSFKTGPFGSLLHKEDYIENGVPVINPTHIIDSKIQSDFNFSVSNEKFLEPV